MVRETCRRDDQGNASEFFAGQNGERSPPAATATPQRWRLPLPALARQDSGVQARPRFSGQPFAQPLWTASQQRRYRVPTAGRHRAICPRLSLARSLSKRVREWQEFVG